MPNNYLINLNMSYLRMFVIMAIVLIAINSPVFAQSAPANLDPVGILNKIIAVLNGPLARALAIIALILMGIACWFGFFDFRKLGFFFLGVVLVFGAAWIMDQFGVSGGTSP